MGIRTITNQESFTLSEQNPERLCIQSFTKKKCSKCDELDHFAEVFDSGSLTVEEQI